jgi:hypothetical protein
MVDVGAKDDTVREAVAEGFVTMTRETLDTILAGNAKKGDVDLGGADRRHHGGEEDTRARSALPPSSADQGVGRDRSPNRNCPDFGSKRWRGFPARPASRWRR